MASSQFLVLIFLIALISMALAAPVPEEHDRHRSGHGRHTTTEEPTATTTTAHEAEPTEHSSKGNSGKGSFNGDGTWYDVGLGSCGWNNDNSELVAAVNHVQMANGGNPNNNPNCGKTITINGPKGSVNVKVVDTCPGCSYGDIDLSPAAFEKIADLSAGRVQIDWTFA
ncbi:RlpA-like double-psi beta-barrel-protein domain-containing protein-containing protein [Dichotomocladium elegans]|nr:RlpA-like double-psi beta-barrel-protein domain-containing protein-containing protein [Dichotomocladium elegans]